MRDPTNGRMLVLDNGYAASYFGGRWVPGVMFSAQGTYDEFAFVSEPQAREIYREAKSCVSDADMLAHHERVRAAKEAL